MTTFTEPNPSSDRATPGLRVGLGNRQGAKTTLDILG
jgi:hypothetical protein